MKKHEDKLDSVLKYLDNTQEFYETKDEIIENGKLSLSPKDTYLILQKLQKDGYIDCLFSTSEDAKSFEIETYMITYSGRLFISRGGYKAESFNLKWKNYKSKISTIALVANAIIIIVLTAAGIYLTYDSGVKDKEISELKKRIEFLTNKNKGK